MARRVWVVAAAGALGAFLLAAFVLCGAVGAGGESPSGTPRTASNAGQATGGAAPRPDAVAREGFAEPPPAGERPPDAAVTETPNVVGSVRSRRVEIGRDENGAVFGLAPGAARMRLSTITEEAHRTTAYAYQPWRPVSDPEGSIALRLQPGFWRLEVEHRPPNADPAWLVEWWCSIFEVGEETVRLGDHLIPLTRTTGTVKNAAGTPIPGILVSFNDKMPLPIWSAISGAGCDLALRTDIEGRFAFSYGRKDVKSARIAEPDPPIRAMYGDGQIESADVSVRPVLLGTHVAIERPRTTPARFAVFAEIDGETTAYYFDGISTSGSRRSSSSEPGKSSEVLVVRDLGPGVLTVELVKGDLISVHKVLILQEGREVLTPRFVPGRIVSGVAGRRETVSRLVGSAEGRTPLRSVEADADGEWRLIGLPPTGALLLDVGGRTAFVPKDAPLIYRIE